MKDLLGRRRNGAVTFHRGEAPPFDPGRLSLADYLKITGQCKPRRWWQWWPTVVSVVMAFAAGTVTPWSGQDTLEMTLEQALVRLEGERKEAWQGVNSATAVFGHAEAAVAALLRAAASDDETGTNASIYVRNLLVQEIRGVTALIDSPELKQAQKLFQQATIKRIEEELKKKAN